MKKSKNQKLEQIAQNSIWSHRKIERQIYEWESNSKLYVNKYSKRVILIVEKDYLYLFEEKNIIPHKRGITLLSKNIKENKNTFLHFIYAPASPQEVKQFWEDTAKELNKKNAPKNKHYLIDDLNAHLNTRKEKEEKIPKGLKDIIKTHNLIDTYTHLNKNENSFTYYRIEQNANKTIKTRVDYMLAPMFSQRCWHFPKYTN